MSASSKKKLRSAERAEKLTEKQLQEQKEAKKLKIFTIAIVAVVALMLVFAIYTAVSRTIINSGVREANTTALTVGVAENNSLSLPVSAHALSNAELNYFYIDSINNFANNYGSYASLFGLDTTKPLDEQFYDEENGTTWADYFLESATTSAQAVYGLNDAAAAAGFTLPEDYAAQIDGTMTNLDAYALRYGYPDTETYVKAMYGNGATVEGLRDYFELTITAEAYQTHYAESLVFSEADLRAEDDADPMQYNGFSYNSYYLAASKFLEGGTTDEEGNTTYSDEEKAASVAACEAAAKALAEGEYADAAALDNAIAALSVNAETENAASTAYTDTLYSSVNSVIRDWVTDSSRKAGEVTCTPSTSTSTDEEGNETTTTNGYYIVMFQGSTDNIYPLANVRHILVAYEGGSYDSTTGQTTYSAEEMATAKLKAEELLEQWKNGDATEESFAALANENSADSDGTDGGLYENVYPGQMVTNFNDWCFDEARQPGDTGIVESSYGYHVMFYSGDSETNYRDFMIENTLRSEAANEWYNTLIEAMTKTEGDTRYIDKDLVLSGN